MINLQNKTFGVLNILPILFIAVISCSDAVASNNIFPAEKWQVSSPEAQGMQTQKLAEMMAHIQKNSLHIDSLLIVRNGYLVLDAYLWPSSKSQKHNIYSCTKSFMSALIGIAIDKGFIQNVDQALTDFFPHQTFADMNDPKRSIRLKDLLMMASGLKCRDSYLYGWAGLVEMKNSHNWAQYVLDLPMAEPPGEKFEYCNGVSHLLSVIIQNTTRIRTLDFARKYLFDPLGIDDLRWETNPQGVYIGYGRMWLKPHDMAKFGWLYLNKGKWGDKQIVPSAWVDVSTKGQIDATIFDRYGYHWWVDSAGYYVAVGYKGQFIFVVPQKNLVAVFTGGLIGPDFREPKNILHSYIIPAAISSEPLVPDSAQKTRLDNLLASVAKSPSKGHIWISENEGVAKEGVFKRTALPAFTFKYPPGSRKAAIRQPGQVMRMKTHSDVFFSAAVIDIPQGMKLADFGPSGYAAQLATVASEIKIISNKEITLACGTKAYRTDITYVWENYIPIKTFLLAAYKDGKCIFIDAHTWLKNQSVGPIVRSLTFK